MGERPSPSMPEADGTVVWLTHCHVWQHEQESNYPPHTHTPSASGGRTGPEVTRAGEPSLPLISRERAPVPHLDHTEELALWEKGP